MLAQRTVVQDAGAGRKLELQYNAAGQATQIKTIGADGQLLQVQNLEYPPGAYVPQSMTTSYWPNGKVHKVTHDTYDINANFTGEFVDVYDETGKQTFGHKLAHDPQSNIYRCQDWNTAAQSYVQVACPAGEESEGLPETVKKFTQDEVTQQLTKARQAAEHPEKPMATAPPATNPMATMAPANSTSAPAGTNVKEFGLIFPAKIRAGDRVSGSVVRKSRFLRRAAGYHGDPRCVAVHDVGCSFDFGGMGSRDVDRAAAGCGWAALAHHSTRPGRVGRAVSSAGRVGAAQVSRMIKLPPGPKAKHATSFLAPAICLKGQACVIQGPFSGDSKKTFAAFEDRPARILAETPDAAYLAIPDRTEPGPRPLVIAEGSKAIAWPMVVAEFSIEPDKRDLKQGELLLQYVTLEGPEELPDQLWLPGNYPVSNLDEARKLIPGFQVPKASHEAKEKREQEEKREAKEKPGAEHEEAMGGEILVVVQNLTPEQATFHASTNGTFVFHLKASSFGLGEFKYKFVAQALKAGSFGVKGYAIPFLAPVAGQEFAAAAK